MDQKLIGKRACVFAKYSVEGNFNGLWAQYYYSSVTNAMVFNTDIAYEKIAYALINPLTAVGILDTIKKKGVNCVAKNGASSALGKIFIRLCAKEGIKTINLVRKEKHIPTLKKLGADYVISTSNDNWEKEFSSLAKELGVSNFFDCVGGEMTSKIMKTLPSKSTVYHFGGLEIKHLSQIETSQLIFHQKQLLGWWFESWLESIKPEEISYWQNYIVKDIEGGSDIFLTDVTKTFKLTDIEKAFEFYFPNMSEGKVILQPNN